MAKMVLINVREIDTEWDFEIRVKELNSKEVTNSIVEYEEKLWRDHFKTIGFKNHIKSEGITYEEYLDGMFSDLRYWVEGHEDIKLDANTILEGIKKEIKKGGK